MYYIYVDWGYLSLFTGDIVGAPTLTTKALDYARKLNSSWHVAVAMSVLGIVAYQQERLNDGYQQLTESLKIWRTIGDPRGLVFCMLYLGMTNLALGDIPDARITLYESNQIAEDKGDSWAHAFGLDPLGTMALSDRNHREALAYFDQSLTLSRGIGDQLGAAQFAIHLGQAHAALGEQEPATRLFREAYTSARDGKWAIILLDALLSFIEMQNKLSAETRLGAVLSILAHPAVTLQLRLRGEQVREAMTAALTAHQIEKARRLATELQPEGWAQEMLG
jgi:tetratricopeptide (TPR) repeat protein